MEYLAFERRLLRLIFRTNVPLTPVHVAYYLAIPIAEARTHLDTMVTSGVLEIDSDDGGHILYSYPMRPALASLPDPKPPRRKKKKPAQPFANAPSGSPPIYAMVPASSSAPQPSAELMLVEER